MSGDGSIEMAACEKLHLSQRGFVGYNSHASTCTFEATPATGNAYC